MKTTDIHIGCSSFNNRFWQPEFYPADMPRSQWFEHYCRHFDTFEINVTFYKFPTVRTLTTWYNKAPSNFKYAVKAPKTITHIAKFVDIQAEIERFYAICREGLREKLGPILFQLPPSFAFNADNLELVLQNLDPNFINVVEFRNKSWWRDEVFEVFREKKVSFCSVSYPGLPDHIVTTTAFGYFRLHGVPRLFYSAYSEEYLISLYERIRTASGLCSAAIYFNNTAGHEGIRNALRAQQLAVPKLTTDRETLGPQL